MSLWGTAAAALLAQGLSAQQDHAVMLAAYDEKGALAKIVLPAAEDQSAAGQHLTDLFWKEVKLLVVDAEAFAPLTKAVEKAAE